MYIKKSKDKRTAHKRICKPAQAGNVLGKNEHSQLDSEGTEKAHILSQPAK